MKNKTLEPKTEARTGPSPCQAERAGAQQTPVLRPGPLGTTLAPPGSESTVRAHAAGLNRATAGRTLRQLQRQYGNRYVQRVVELAQRHGSGEGFTLDDDTAGRINRARGGGQSLDSVVQAQMSEALGHDFSGVRVHTDAEADALNRQLSARALTTGYDIFFGRGEYNPGSGSGRELIAHELTHVVQQSTGQVSGGGSGMTVRPAGDAFEHKADSRAKRVIAHRGYGSQVIQRLKNDPMHAAQGQPAAVTNNFRPIRWDPAGHAMNCHGHTYGTWLRWHRNPHQMADDGVKRIVEEEAGGMVYGPIAANAFNYAAAVRNLITIRVGPVRFGHSARVVQAGANAQQIRVTDVQGYGGVVNHSVALANVAQFQANQGRNQVTVWARTPTSF